jgi:hypothetical protein
VEVGPSTQIPYIFGGAGRKVVEREDLPAVAEQALAQMRADEARAPGDEHTSHDRRAYLGHSRAWVSYEP